MTEELHSLSMVAQIAELKSGETASKALVLDSDSFTEAHAKDLRTKLANNLAPAIARAKAQRPGRTFTMQTFVAFTQSLNVVVGAVITRTDDEEDEL